jgi:uncharacterized protein
MQLDREQATGNVIRSYAPGSLRVNQQLIEGPVIVSAASLIADWNPAPLEELSIADFQPALDQSPELILFGTGPQQRFPSAHLIAAIMRGGVGFEVMETGAACRTFNVLSGERRRVVAALLLR